MSGYLPYLTSLDTEVISFSFINIEYKKWTGYFEVNGRADVRERLFAQYKRTKVKDIDIGEVSATMSNSNFSYKTRHSLNKRAKVQNF